MKLRNLKKIFVISFSGFLLGACSTAPSRPTLYPNEVLKERGPIIAKADIDLCLREADVYFNTPEGKKAASSSNWPSTSVGTSVGIGTGGVGFGLGMGSGHRHSRYGYGHEHVVTSTDIKRAFVNQCLVNKGYQVLVWD